MRLVILSSTQFGHQCLQAAILIEPSVSLVGILTTPKEITLASSDKPLIVSSYFDYKAEEASLGCPVFQLADPPDTAKYLELLSDLDAEIVMVLGWYFLIPSKVRQAVPNGCLGIHASLLPKYRGMSPVTWVLINGERETGVTLFHLEKGVDTGDIVAQRRIPISDEDDCKSLYDKVTRESITILRENLPRLADGTAPRTPQDHSLATQFGRRTEDDGHIDWSLPSMSIYNFVRAQTRPYPGAFSILGENKVRLWRAELSDMPRPDVQNGQLIIQGGRPRVITGDGVLILDDYKIERPKGSLNAPQNLSDGHLLT